MLRAEVNKECERAAAQVELGKFLRRDDADRHRIAARFEPPRLLRCDRIYERAVLRFFVREGARITKVGRLIEYGVAAIGEQAMESEDFFSFALEVCHRFPRDARTFASNPSSILMQKSAIRASSLTKTSPRFAACRLLSPSPKGLALSISARIHAARACCSLSPTSSFSAALRNARLISGR